MRVSTIESAQKWIDDWKPTINVFLQEDVDNTIDEVCMNQTEKCEISWKQHEESELKNLNCMREYNRGQK